MKKTIAVLLVLITVCVSGMAAAQEIEIHRQGELFYLVVTLPAGASVTSSVAEEQFTMTTLDYITGGKPTVVIRVAPDELYAGQNLSDVSGEDLELIISGITLEMAQPVVDIRMTGGGYEYIVANESTQSNDICTTTMLVNGFFIMVLVYYTDNSELTEADQEIGPAVVETFRLVGNTNS